MSLATAEEIRLHGNLTDTIVDTQINPQIPIATQQLQAYIGLAAYEEIVLRDDNDKVILTAAENKWALGLLMEPLAIHCAGDGLAFMGGVGDSRFQYIDPTVAAKMGRRYIAEAKSLVALWVPKVDTVGDGRNQVLATGKVDMVAV